MLFDVFIKSSNENIAKLKQAIEDNDYDAIYLCSHSLKGSSGNLLVDEVYNLSKEIESAAKDKKSIDYTAYCDKIHAIFQNLTLK